jgi:hypothetical protein
MDSSNFLNIVKQIMRFPDKEVRDVSSKAIQTNGYFTHPESILIGLLGNLDLRE